jgi:hypothetical protein
MPIPVTRKAETSISAPGIAPWRMRTVRSPDGRDAFAPGVSSVTIDLRDL